ncbi:hypothetical protein RHSIM_Rhsim08G0139100 [Rhododendron simsii]|uniref:CCHC-type domain-containing protein n=1 Tax=Rhododendron simsii TaxID=118357 RepID=A0A834GH70_RHOSS|nr:hypothetical protein RHSIM_Rhsim08G0139100 [Rhododendron simsii]
MLVMESNQRLERLEQQVGMILALLQNQNQPPPPPLVVNVDLNVPPIIPPENPPPPEPVINEVRVRDFQKLKPLVFHRGIDPIKANEWLESVEKIFQVMTCMDREKVALAAYNLIGEARRWWNLVSKAEPRMEWTHFLVLFNQKYLPQAIKDSKSMEFQNLKQRGNMTVTEYDAQFTTLAHYAEHLIPNDSMKARRFEDGLQPDLGRAVKLLKLETYAEVLDRALMLEAEEENNKRIRELKKRRYANSNPRVNNGPPKRQNVGNPNRGNQNQYQNRGVLRPNCPTCGANHPGVCLKGTGVCYSCGEAVHTRKNCPKLQTNPVAAQGNGNQRGSANAGRNNSNQRQTGNAGQGQRQGRVYALVPGNTQESENVVAGTLMICYQHMHL